MQPTPEVLPHVANAALYLAFGLRPIQPTRMGHEAAIGGIIQIALIPDNPPAPVPRDNRILQVVMQHFLRNPTKILKSVLVATDEPVRTPAHREFHIHRS